MPIIDYGLQITDYHYQTTVAIFYHTPKRPSSELGVYKVKKQKLKLRFKRNFDILISDWFH